MHDRNAYVHVEQTRTSGVSHVDLQQQGSLHFVQYCSPLSCALPLMHFTSQQADRMIDRRWLGSLRRSAMLTCFEQYCLPCEAEAQPFIPQMSRFLWIREGGGPAAGERTLTILHHGGYE